jgi:hypothetical protein
MARHPIKDPGILPAEGVLSKEQGRMRYFHRDRSGLRRSRPGQVFRKVFLPLQYLALLGLLAVVITVGAQTPTGTGNPPTTPAPMTAQGANPGAAPAAASPLDQPLRLANQAAQTFARVRDYTGLMVKQERLNGKLQPENLVEIKMRTQPFSVNLRWLAPKESAGQEVCYVAGQNQNQMLVHSKGILGVMGFVKIDPRDPRVMQHSRHTITEAGIGNLIGQLQAAWQMEKPLNKTEVRVAEYEYNKRRCIRVEAIRPQNLGGRNSCYRTVVYFDKENTLPVRLELYDWPRQSGPAGGDLLESYSYFNMRFNVGLTDATFKH